MDRLLTMDAEALAVRMQAEFQRVMKQVGDAVNAAPTGNVISGSEMQVSDLMAEFQRRVFETAVQMRIDSTESSFSPSGRRGRQAAGQQGAVPAKPAQPQRTDRVASPPLRSEGLEPLPGGPAGG
jgi:hypothetical protein